METETNKEMKIAVLIDAENVASKYISIVLTEANNLGNIIIKRIYGDWTNQQMSSWRNVILDNSVQPIQQYSNVSGKNASDSALIIDAMDLLYQGRVNAFCIVSSDSDFTRLAARLRESEMYVLGMGEQKTPQSFISACSKFSYIDLLYNASFPETRERKSAKDDAKSASGSAKTSRKGTKKPDGTDRKEETAVREETAVHEEASIRSEEKESRENAGVRLKIIRSALISIAEENSDDDGWISSSLLGNLLGRQYPDFDVRNFRFKKFVPFIESLGLFESRRQSLNVFFRLKS